MIESDSGMIGRSAIFGYALFTSVSFERIGFAVGGEQGFEDLVTILVRASRCAGDGVGLQQEEIRFRSCGRVLLQTRAVL